MRMYEMFMGPLQVSAVVDRRLVGVYRFLDRTWRLFTERTVSDQEPSAALLKTLHKSIKKVSEDTASLNFNTAIAQMMILVNDLKEETLPRRSPRHWQLLSPTSPTWPRSSGSSWGIPCSPPPRGLSGMSI